MKYIVIIPYWSLKIIKLTNEQKDELLTILLMIFIFYVIIVIINLCKGEK